MNQQMIVFGEDWGRHPSSTQHLVNQLMRHYEVIWVNSIGMRRPRLCLKDIRRMAEKVGQMMKHRAQTENFSQSAPYIVAPGTLPLPGSKLARRVNCQLLQQHLAPLINESQSRGRPLLWTSLPSAVDMVGTLGEAASIYYCGDDFSALEGVDHDVIGEMERELVDKVDLILAASPEIAARFPADRTHVISHGVDYALFSQPSPPAPELTSPNGPVVGFYGSLAGWLDQELILEAARTLSGWKFVLVGPASVDVEALAQQPNIELLGPRAHHELPGYVQHWDVSILPFHQTQQIGACNPLKLREYMAAGTPIVSTDFPALAPYRDLIRVARDSRSFINALRHARTESESLRESRRQRVAGESWLNRADEVQQLIQASITETV